MEQTPIENMNASDTTAGGSFVPEAKSGIPRLILISTILIFLFGYAITVYWSFEPDRVEIHTDKAWLNEADGKSRITGYTVVNTLANVIELLLDKPGGFLGNDIAPPSLFMDNMPAFEYGVLIQSRDLTRALRNDFSRSQSQSSEQDDLKVAEPKMYIAHGNWMLPSPEGEYRDAVVALRSYLEKLSNSNNQESQFYARADNLRDYLGEVSTRLGSYSQKLSASVGEERINTDLAGDSAATQSTNSGSNIKVKTPWFEIDDVFYEARGASWALAQYLRAIEIDFAEVLEKKNALTSLRQIIRELDATQETIWSPMILNGSGFGLMANHSLVMASYISRANAGLIDLRELLSRG
jgi:hypothetical protein